MRLSITLEEQNYRLAKSLAREEDISISKAVNRLLNRQREEASHSSSSKTKSGFTPVAGKQVVTSEDVMEFLDDQP